LFFLRLIRNDPIPEPSKILLGLDSFSDLRRIPEPALLADPHLSHSELAFVLLLGFVERFCGLREELVDFRIRVPFRRLLGFRIVGLEDRLSSVLESENTISAGFDEWSARKKRNLSYSPEGHSSRFRSRPSRRFAG
jgi:hypothetical protein